VRVNIGDLLADRRAVRVVAFSESIESPGEETTLLEPVRGELMLTPTGRTVGLTGRMHTAVSLVCGACLARYRQPLEFTVAEEFGRTPAPAVASRGEAVLGPEDFVVPIGPDGMVDVTEVVRQHLVLAIPFAPRCRDGCRGLCARCGADLNLRPCACATE